MKPGKFKVKFLLESRKDKSTGETIIENIPINMDVTFNGQRLRFYSNYRIDSSKWDSENQRVRNNNTNNSGQTASEINQRIVSLTATVNEIFRYYENLKTFPTVEQLRLEIRNRLNENINEAHLTGHSFFSRFQQYIDEAELSPLRKKQVKSAMTHLKKYNELTTFENINLNGFKKSLLSDKDKEKSLNTVIGILKKVRSFYTYARIKKWTKANPFENFLIGSEKYGEPIYITKAERDLIFEKKIENGRLSRVRDMFILQCLIGARIADFLKLTKDNIVNGAIEYVPAKTANKSLRKVRIPLCEKAKTIIDRYNLPDGSLVPYISAEKYNEYLKELFALCDLDRPVLRLNPITRKNEVIPLWKLATSHMARRTFIGLLHRNVKNEVIASMSGHTNDSRAFARYYKIDEDIQREAIESIN